MPVIMPDEQFPAKPVIVMIVGTPGSKKSSLAMTARKALHIDGDGGAQRAVRTCPVLDVKSWAEIRMEDEKGIFKDKETCIFDTPKSLLDDFLWEWCQQQKYYADDRKVYGAIATELKAFIAKRRLEGMDIIFVSHEKSSEKKNGVVYEADITGQTKQLVLRMCDQVGFMEKREVKGANGQNTIQTVLTFNATPEWPFCKNTGRIEDIIIPPYTSAEWKTFMQDRVIQPTKDAMAKMSDDQLNTLNFISDWRLSIDAIEGNDETTGAELLTTMTEIGKIAEDHLRKQITPYFIAHYKKIGFKYIKESNTFVPAVAKVAETPPNTPPAETPPPVEQAQPPVVQAESNPAALVNNAPPVSPSIQFPEQATAEEEEKDPFENVEE